jgi:hypothetical protein
MLTLDLTVQAMNAIASESEIAEQLPESEMVEFDNQPIKKAVIMKTKQQEWKCLKVTQWECLMKQMKKLSWKL